MKWMRICETKSIGSCVTLSREQRGIASRLKRWWNKGRMGKRDVANNLTLELSIGVKCDVGIWLDEIGIANPLPELASNGRNPSEINDAFFDLIQNSDGEQIGIIMEIIVASCDRNSKMRLFSMLHDHNEF